MHEAISGIRTVAKECQKYEDKIAKFVPPPDDGISKYKISVYELKKEVYQAKPS